MRLLGLLSLEKRELERRKAIAENGQGTVKEIKPPVLLPSRMMRSSWQKLTSGSSFQLELSFHPMTCISGTISDGHGPLKGPRCLKDRTQGYLRYFLFFAKLR